VEGIELWNEDFTNKFLIITTNHSFLNELGGESRKTTVAANKMKMEIIRLALVPAGLS